MTIAQTFLSELDSEFANTRKVLERIPDDRLDWQPHAKSMTLRALASHLAENPDWTDSCINSGGIDIPADYKPWSAADRAELLAHFDQSAAAATKMIASTSDQTFMETWTLKLNGVEVFCLPKVAVTRSFIISHMIHHRAQLGVYLRLLDVPVPSVYGPSADDPGPMP